MTFTITAKDHNTRLDKFLMTKLPEFSRSQIQKMIKDGAVTVSGKKISVHRFLKEGDKVLCHPERAGRSEGSLASKKERDSSLLPTGRQVAQNDNNRITGRKGGQKAPPPKIIFENDDILVIDKPAGLLTHARDEKLLNQEPTVVDWAIEKYPAIKKVGDKPQLRPGIVHRLDKETSGIMVIAKTQAAFEHLKKQFSEHTVKKEYYAWVYGKMSSNYDIINFPIGRSEDGGKMAARPNSPIEDENDKAAVTEYEVLKQLPNRALVKVMPKTGRTHQIRVHFFALNHPVIGDPMYQSKSYKTIPSDRMLLHAHKLTFTDLAGEEKTFTAPLPKEYALSF